MSGGSKIKTFSSSRAGKGAILALILGFLGWLVQASEFLRPLDQVLVDWRSAATQRPASGDLIVIEIDGQALEEMGQWPSPRNHYSGILSFLVDNGASDIFFDVDFTSTPDPKNDARFFSILERGNGSIHFSVPESIDMSLEQTREIYNSSYERFVQAGAVRFVKNTLVADGGNLRYYPYGEDVNGSFVPSPAFSLSKQSAHLSANFQIDFRINPNTIPIYSAASLFGEELDTQNIQGKTVIISETTGKFGEKFPVPLYGMLASPLLHALASETLIGATSPVLTGALLPSGIHTLFLILSVILFRKRLVILFSSAVAFLFAGEFLVSYIFWAHSFIVPTSQIYLITLAFLVSNFMAQEKQNHITTCQESGGQIKADEVYQTVFDDSFDAIIVADENCNPITASKSALTLLCVECQEDVEIPDKISDVLRGHFRLGISTPTKLRTTQFRINNRDIYLQYMITISEHKSSASHQMSSKRIATISIRNVTELKEKQRHISYLSNFDEQTGAFRRPPFLEFMKLRIASGEPFAVFALNLHRFKTINVTLGRHVGDAVLKEVVNRLGQGNEHISSPVRLGGDSFAMYTETSCTPQEADKLAKWVSDVVSQPYKLENSSAQVGGIVGYYLYENNQDIPISPQDALSRAEEALDTARLNKSNTPVLFSPRLSTQQLRARQIERSLISALDNDEFFLTYQPQHRVQDGKLIGAEALIRWTSPTLGTIYPDEFIGIAESTGFINELGRWILVKSFEDALQASDDLSIAVNISGIQLINTDIVSELAFALENSGIDPKRVCLELTESVFLSSLDQIVSKMNAVKNLGVTWALDDFGTGYSSLSYLSTLPLDKIKLDKSFIMDLHQNPTSNAIMHSVVELCKGLGVSLLCEGVELESHLSRLKKKGVNEAQGYYFSKPLTQKDFIDYETRG
jgi:diguanylate cyclase (GGDEF)-like protein